MAKLMKGDLIEYVNTASLTINAAKAAAMIVFPSSEHHYSNKSYTKMFAVTRSKGDFESSQYQFEQLLGSAANLPRVHLIDLSEYDYDKASIVYTQNTKYKKIVSPPKLDLFRHFMMIDKTSVENEIDFEVGLIEAYEQLDCPTDFFNLYEPRTEHIIKITLVKKGVTVERIRINMGYFTAIYVDKELSYRTTKSSEKMATRHSFNYPLLQYGLDKAVCVFNESNIMYRSVVEMMRY